MTDTDDTLQRYATLMEAVKKRQAVVANFLTRRKTTGFLITDVEFVCLQFRKMLEHISLANLVANKEEYSKQHEKFNRHWNAKRILNDIEKINSDFYPVPTRQVIDPKTNNVRETVKIDKDYLTKDNFIEVYDECSNILHTNNPYGETIDIKKTQAKFADWYTKIINLLNHHQVQLVDSKKQIWTLMQAKSDGKVHCTLFEQVEKEEI